MSMALSFFKVGSATTVNLIYFASISFDDYDFFPFKGNFCIFTSILLDVYGSFLLEGR